MRTGTDTVIFDMDGTVLNTLEDLTNSVNYVLRRVQMPKSPWRYSPCWKTESEDSCPI